MIHYGIRYFLSPVLQGTSILFVLTVYSVGNMGFKILRYSEAGSQILTWHKIK